MEASHEEKTNIIEIVESLFTWDNIIRENKIPQIKTAIQTSADEGMVTLEQDLQRLVKAKLVDKEVVEYYLQTLPKL